MTDERDHEQDFEALFEHDNSFEMGVRAAACAMKKFLDEDFYFGTKDDLVPEEWLGHIVATGGECGCSLEVEYDSHSRLEINLCQGYNSLTFRQEWFRKWHNMTEEEFAAKIQAERDEERRKQKAHEEAARQYRLEKLHELAKEFGVDPNLLP